MRGCGTAYPPADGTREREIIDRFRDFLSEGWQPGTKDRPLRLTAAARYRFHFLIWRMDQVPK